MYPSLQIFLYFFCQRTQGIRLQSQRIKLCTTMAHCQCYFTRMCFHFKNTMRTVCGYLAMRKYLKKQWQTWRNETHEGEHERINSYFHIMNNVVQLRAKCSTTIGNRLCHLINHKIWKWHRNHFYLWIVFVDSDSKSTW